MLTPEELKKLITDTLVSDDEVYEALKTYTDTIAHNEKDGKLIPVSASNLAEFTDITLLLAVRRRGVHSRLKRYTAIMSGR